MDKRILVAAMAGILAAPMAAMGQEVRIERQEPAFDGWMPPRRSGKAHSRTPRWGKTNRKAAYKAQRAANRQRRKLEARRG